ncbi:MAG: L,D-transpeptidase, partial [bacterium]
MKKRWIWIIIAAVAPLLTAVVAFLLLTKGPELPSLPPELSSDSLNLELPTDAKLAQKELQKAHQTLNKLKPSKPYIVIDTHANKVRLRTEDKILYEAVCSTGYGGELVDSTTGKRWVFNTPRGVFKINSKLTDPWWRKPDWAFIEEDEEIPDDPSERFDPEMLGEYAMGFGDGYF